MDYLFMSQVMKLSVQFLSLSYLFMSHVKLNTECSIPEFD